MINLGTLVEIKDLREVWPHEAHDFTPWLAKNIGVLSETVGIDISIEETESSVGDFNVDIFAIVFHTVEDNFLTLIFSRKGAQ